MAQPLRADRRRADEPPSTTDRSTSDAVRRNVVFLVVDRRADRRHVRRYTVLARPRARARPRPAGRHSVVLVAGRQVQERHRSTSPSTSSATASTPSASLEPEISRQGNDIVIDLPGVKDRDKADRARRQDRRAAVPAGARRRCRPRPQQAKTPPRPPRPRRATPRPPPRRSRATPRRRPPSPRATTPRSCRRSRRSRPRVLPATSATHAWCCPTSRAARRRPATTSARPPSPARGPSSTAKAEFVPNQGWTVKMDLTGSRQQQVGRPRPAAVPQAGRDRARRRGAVGARRSRPSDTSRRSAARGDLGELHAGRGRRPRQAHPVRRAAGQAQAGERRERVADARQRPAPRGHPRRAHRARAGGDLHAGLLPAARPRRDRRPPAQRHGDLHDDRVFLPDVLNITSC